MPLTSAPAIFETVTTAALPGGLPVTTRAGRHSWDGPVPCAATMSGHFTCGNCGVARPLGDRPVREAIGTAVATGHYGHDVDIIVPGIGTYALAAVVADWFSQQHETAAAPDGLDAGAYRRRMIGDLPDTEALRALRDAGTFVMLYGSPGGGKTRMALEAFPDLITFCGDGDTTYDDLVGSWAPSAEHGHYVWADGPLVTAMREGRPFFFDDCALVSPKVAAALYPVLDGRAEITVSTHMIPAADGTWHPETVKAGPGFWCAGAWNPGTHGSVLSEALASRFAVHIQVETDYGIALAMGLDRRVVKVAENMKAQRDSGGGAGWVPQMREILAFTTTAAILGETAAIGNLLGQCPAEDQPELRKIIAVAFGTDPGTVLAAGKAAA